MAATMSDILLPPVYRLLAIDQGDALPRACAEAAADAGAGTVVWSRRPDRLDCAVILEPEVPFGQARPAIYVVMLGLGDALAALGPPGKPASYAWPRSEE